MEIQIYGVLATSEESSLCTLVYIQQHRGLTLVDSCSLAPPLSEMGERISKVKVWKLMGSDKDSLIIKKTERIYKN